MEMFSVQSSQIAEIGHDGQSCLRVLFRRGGLYEYASVSSLEFDALKASDSIGAHFSRFIRGAKPFRKLEDSPRSPSAPASTTAEPAQNAPSTLLPAEAQEVSRKSTDLASQAQAVEIRDEPSEAYASGLLLTIASMRQEIADTFKPMKDAGTPGA